ncbi:hypothetical protein GGX14DRAFT_587091 [Mycena pura]|uniref:Amine oxidase domain-containing protein n=1 Tax=Mycena pura TaxID=153505 RepID=A0AAD6Y6Y3_9AGAR|nr:hypothetical protein GGX14DRAFT_587091 [Mycena pura]
MRMLHWLHLLYLPRPLDVVIIGGGSPGSAGTYTAIRLQQQGKSVFVIEKEDVLGGHTNTFHVPGTSTTFDYGVMVFANISLVNKYFADMGVALKRSKRDALGLLDVGARTIKYAKLNGGDVTATTTAPTFVSWSNATNYAPFLTTGYDLSDPVPEELLMPWGAFAREHDIEAFDYTLFTTSPSSTRKSSLGFLTTAAHNNHALYDAALARLQAGANNSAIAVSSNVTRIVRSASSVSVSVSTPGGAKTVHAKQLVIAIPPTLPNLISLGLDLTANERALSAQFNNSYYWNMVIAGTGIPDNLFIDAIDFAAPDAIPALPGLYGVGSAGVDGLAVAYFGSPHHMGDAQVKAETVAALRRLAHANGWDNNGRVCRLPQPRAVFAYGGRRCGAQWVLSTPERAAGQEHIVDRRGMAGSGFLPDMELYGDRGAAEGHGESELKHLPLDEGSKLDC